MKSQICYIFVVFIQLASADLIGLYDNKDNVTILTGANFNDTIFNSQFIWIVEFYSSWCGHCQEFAPTFKGFAKDIAEWQGVIQMAVINCPEEISRDLCRRMAVTGYPEMRVFPPFSNASNPGQRLPGNARTVPKLRDVAVDNVEKYLDDVKWTLEGINKPTFAYATLQEVLNFLLSRQGPHYYALVIEAESSDVGKQIILDISSCKNITTHRIVSESDEMSKIREHTHLELDDIPTVLVFMKTGLFKEIIVKVKARSFYSHKLRNLPGVGDPELLPKSTVEPSKSSGSDVDWKDVDRGKVYMADIESGLRYALTVEVASVKVLEGDTLEALRTFLTTLAMLSEELPIQASTRNFLGRLVAWLVGKEEIGYKEWKERMEEKEDNSYLPQSNQRWVGCAPSQPGLRGYPCSLWTLFHAMTVASYNMKEEDMEAVPRAMEEYIDYFFGCTECRENFAKELGDSPYQGQFDSNKDLVLWLWRLHNKVNKRLHGAVSEDPKILKVQFPPSELCANCHVSQGWDEERVFDFLVKFYSRGDVSKEYMVTSEKVAKKEEKPQRQVHAPPERFLNDNQRVERMEDILDQDFVMDTEVKIKGEFDNDFDGGAADEAFERAGKGKHSKLGHSILINELLDDRSKEHPMDVLQEFGGFRRERLHPKDLGSYRQWHGDEYRSGFTGFDTSLCVVLWGSSLVAVSLLYFYVRRRRMSKYCRA